MRLRTMPAAVALVVLGGLAACSGAAPSATPTPGASAVAATTSTPSATSAMADPEHPVGVIAVGHSGMTGFQSNPDSPGEDAPANSWATGTNPAVNSVYERLVAVRPEIAGHVVNVARNGEKADGLAFQVRGALAKVPTPALALVMIMDNDIRCDGTDPEHLPEFRAQVRAAVEALVKASPEVTVMLASGPGRPADYAKAIATLPTTPVDLVGDGRCDIFSANRTVNAAGVQGLTSILEAYEAELARACEGILQCHTDGGALARHRGDRLEEYGNDVGHPSVLGHQQWAATIWPVVAEAMDLG